MDKKIIGIDVSKKTLDVAFYDGKLKSHKKVSNDVTGFQEMEVWLSSLSLDGSECFFCMEHTGEYTYSLTAYLQEKEWAYSVVGGIDVKRYFPYRKGKSDKADSAMIAQYAYERKEQLKLSKMRPSIVYQLRSLYNERNLYTKQRADLKAQITEDRIYDSEAKKLRLKRQIENLSLAIREVESEIQALIDSEESFHKNYDLCLTIPGIGKVSAWQIIIATGNFTAFKSARKFASYICVAPFPYASGTSIRGRDHTSHVGRKDIKATLTQAAKSASYHDTQTKEYLARKVSEGKNYGVVINAIRFKLLCRIFAVIKRQQPYVETYAYKAKQNSSVGERRAARGRTTGPDERNSSVGYTNLVKSSSLTIINPKYN